MNGGPSPRVRRGTYLYLRLVWSNLGVHPLRSALSAVAIALQVFLILLIVGLTAGVLADWRQRAEGVGADIIVQPPNSSIFFSFSNAVIPESMGDDIRKLPGVREVAPVFIVTDMKFRAVIYGIDYEQFNALGSGFTFVSGGTFRAPNDAMADDLAASERKLKIGQTITLMNRDFTLRGIVVHGKGARFYLPIKTAQEIAGAENRVSMIYVRSDGDTNAVLGELMKRFPEYRIRSMAEYLSLMTSSSLPELTPFINSFVGLGVVISFLVVLLTMYTMVLERRREIGVLKAIGSTRLEICALIVGEALMLVALGAVVGLIGTYAVKLLMHWIAPTTLIEIDRIWILRAILVAVVGAVAGAAYPALRAAASDPVEVLAYE